MNEVGARFVQGNTEWKFEAELEDGEIELDIKEEITGPSRADGRRRFKTIDLG